MFASFEMTLTGRVTTKQEDSIRIQSVLTNNKMGSKCDAIEDTMIVFICPKSSSKEAKEFVFFLSNIQINRLWR